MKSFVDTNVFVYAYDQVEPPEIGMKHLMARDLLVRLWETRRGVVSVQVVGHHQRHRPMKRRQLSTVRVPSATRASMVAAMDRARS